MKIWFVNQYNSMPEHGHLNRHYNLAKAMAALGHKSVVFAGSTPHNRNIQLVPRGELFRAYKFDGFQYVYVRVLRYQHSRLKRVFAMFQYYLNTWRTVKKFNVPDVIVGSSAHPLNALFAIHLSKKLGCENIVEIRDLWPESIVAFNILPKDNLIVKILYNMEKYLYKSADALVFTMPGGVDYIREKGWDIEHGGPVDIRKVYYINNGVDISTFDCDRDTYCVKDKELSDPDTFKMVYTGTIRLANNIDLVLDAAKCLMDTRVKFLIWGDGTELERLKRRCRMEDISNVVFKERIDKRQVPSILSQADATFFVLRDSPLYRFGLSLNKSFEYLAAGKPMLIVGSAEQSLIDEYHCGIHAREATTDAMEKAVRLMLNASRSQYAAMCDNARRAADNFDFRVLAKKFETVVAGITK